MTNEEIMALGEYARAKYKTHPEEEYNPERYTYPEGMERVSYGTTNCELILFFGPEYTAIVDVGTAYCAPRVVENIREALAKHGRSKLDFVLLSHSHYDHVGALPYIIKAWPDVRVYASEKCKKVFESEGARKLMKTLGESARETYGKGLWDDTEILTDPLRVDEVVRDGDRISLGGDEYFSVIEAKGHTDCSLAFGFEPKHILFASESTGVYRNHYFIHTAILKSQNDALATSKRCREYQPGRIISPHYGLVPSEITDRYFDIFEACVKNETNMVLEFRDHAENMEEMLELFKQVYWGSEREKEQPIEAFFSNATPIIKVILRENKRGFENE